MKIYLDDLRTAPDAALTSRGVANEVKEAEKAGIPVRYITDEDLMLAPD